MKLECEVAVVGGGIIGATVAAALADKGIGVVLLERDGCAAQGASRYSGGIVRLYDPDPFIMALAAHSLRCLRTHNFGREFARSLVRTGVLYRAPAGQEQAVRAALAAHADALHPVSLRGGASWPDFGPWGRPRPQRLDLLEPQSGVADVRKAVRCMTARVHQQGLLLENVRVRNIETEDEERATLVLDRGSLRCRVVVVAAGAWAGDLWPGLGLQARTIPLVRLWASAPARLPVIDAVSGNYVVPMSGHWVQVGSRLRHAASRPEELPPPGEPHQADALERLSDLTGQAEAGPVLDVLGGSDAYTPDGRPLLGFAGAQPVYLATGMSGIGFKLAPGVADIAAQDIAARLGHQPQRTLDAWAALRPARLLAAAQPELVP